jgi:hypothetical protein
VNSKLENEFIRNRSQPYFSSDICCKFGFLLVLTKSWNGAVIIDTILGIKKFHSTPTPHMED